MFRNYLKKFIPATIGGDWDNVYNRAVMYLRYRLKPYRNKAKDELLSQLVFETSPMRIMEIGTMYGGAAEIMIKASKRSGVKRVEYFGFDKSFRTGQLVLDLLFINGKQWVKSKLESLGAEVHLYEGDTRSTLRRIELPPMDFVYIDGGHQHDVVKIDGGHQHDVVKSDWETASKFTYKKSMVVFDDYGPTYYGVADVVDEIKTNRDWVVEILPIPSETKGKGFAVIKKKKPK